MTTEVLLMVGAFLILMMIRVPLGIALAASAGLGILVAGINPLIVVQSFYSGTQSWVLMAVPFFVLTGTLMENGGLSRRLLAFVDSAFGFLPGGIANVNVGGSILFGGISGSAVADTSALGPVMIPAMERKGYPKPYAAALTAASSPLGMIIPPSIPMIVWSSVSGASLAGLFVGGIVPGILTGVLMMVLSYVIARRRGFMTEGTPFSLKLVLASAIHGVVVILAPVIIIVGIYTGIFTPTEAGVVAAAYVLIVLVLLYRSLSWKDLWRSLVAAGKTSASIMFLLAGAAVFSYVLSRAKVPQAMGESILQIAGDNAWLVMLIACALIFILGMFLDVNVIILLIGPVLAPVVVEAGIDPVVSGVIFMLVLATGLITPPMGLCLLVVTSISGVRFEAVTKEVLPFVGLFLAVATLLWFCPFLITGF